MTAIDLAIAALIAETAEYGAAMVAVFEPADPVPPEPETDIGAQPCDFTYPPLS